MEAIDFKEVNVRIAEDQPEYETLPVLVDFNNEEHSATMCFQLSAEEVAQVAATGRIWLTVLTFGRNFQPIYMSCLKPDNVTDPEIGKKDGDMLRAEVLVYLPDGCDIEKEKTQLHNSIESNFSEITGLNVFTVKVEPINTVTDVDFEEACHVCGCSDKELFECQRCHELYCEDCRANYNQFTQIDYDCCSSCGERRGE